MRLHSVGARRLSESESNSGSVVPFRGDGMMAFTMRPTGLGSGIDKDRPDYTVVAGEWPHLRNTPRSRQSALVLVDDRQRPDDALGSRGGSGGGQGAVPEELGRLEGVGDAGRGAIDLRCRPRRRPRRSGKKNPAQVGPERGFQRAVRLRLGTPWTPNRASRPRPQMEV